MYYQYKSFEQTYSKEEKGGKKGGNQLLFMTRDISKEIIKRSRLCYRFLKNKSLQNTMLHTQQRNYCVSLLRKTNIRYYANLNEKKL